MGDKQNPASESHDMENLCEAAEGYSAIGQPDIADAALGTVEDMAHKDDRNG